MLKKSYKNIGDHNPVMTQRFGADPYALVYVGRVYLYMTGDELMYDEAGNVKENDYTNIVRIHVISSDDLVNWTDHGSVFASSADGLAKWGHNSWAPAAACKEVNGKMQFFLYFANGGDGIAVLRGDSPVGPFEDPLGCALISREKTPTCADVTWLFDPAVLVDGDDAYIYFGGGVPTEDMAALPNTARVAKLGKDMIHLDGDPVRIDDLAYLFEDSGINKVGDQYIYTYCSNFSVPDAAAKEQDFGNGEIIAMESDSPMGPFRRMGSILKNPEDFFGLGGNNHHAMFEFLGKWYMTYHSRILEESMGILHNYRSTNIDEVQINNGRIEPIIGTRKGVRQVKYLNPYQEISASTIGVMASIQTVEGSGVGNMVVKITESGSFLGVYGVDFSSHCPERVILSIRDVKKAGTIKICIDQPDGEEIAVLEVKENCNNERLTAQVQKSIKGCHDLYFIFEELECEFDSWRFK